jgi:hypothetical protein
METGGAFWMSGLMGSAVLAVYFFAAVFGRCRGPRVVLFAALAVMVSGPADAMAVKLQTVPVGFLAVIGSFLLFGLGTAVAFTRHRWHRGA